MDQMVDEILSVVEGGMAGLRNHQQEKSSMVIWWAMTNHAISIQFKKNKYWSGVNYFQGVKLRKLISSPLISKVKKGEMNSSV